MDPLYAKLKNVNLGAQSDDYFRGLGFSTGRQGAIDYMANARQSDPAYLAQQQQQQAQQAWQQQQTAQKDWLGRFNTTVAQQEPLDAMYARYGQQFGLGNALQGVNAAQSAFANIQPASLNRAQQYGLNSSQMNELVGVAEQQQAPALAAATQNFGNIQNVVGQQTQLGAQQEQKALMPLEQEGQMLSQNTGIIAGNYSTAQQNQLNTMLTQASQGFQLDMAQVQQAAQIAMAEHQAQTQLQLQELKNQALKSVGRYGVYDPATQAIIGGMMGGGVAPANTYGLSTPDTSGGLWY